MALSAGIGYAVVAAFLWGGYVFALKRYFDDVADTVLPVLVNATAIAWYLPYAAVTLPPTALADLSLDARGVAVVAVTVVGVAVAFVLFLRAIDVGEVSYVAPINKIVPVFVLPIEVGLLGQRLTPLQLAGVGVATLAVYVANYRRGSFLEPLRRAASSRPAQLALLSAACYAVSDVGKRVALQELGVPTQVWVPLLLGGVIVVMAPLAARSWPDRRTLRRVLPKFVAAGALVAVAEHVTSLAFAAAPASIASPIINTQAVVAVVLGGLILRERAFRTRLVAAGLAVCGVALVAA